MNRITAALRRARAERRKVLALFLTAGLPRRTSTVPYVLALEQAGADLIELGMPFSDPLADGPIIQQGSALALRNGITLSTLLGDVEAVRKRSQIPLVLMGYLNPILKYGTERFLREAAGAGVDGLILPELPLEEAGRWRPLCLRFGLAPIMLVAPTSSDDRIRRLDRASRGFLYAVSTTGVTGSKNGPPPEAYLRRVKRLAGKHPVLVGFGIATPQDARQLARTADGVIVGSALIRRILDGQPLSRLSVWVRRMKRGLDPMGGRG